MEKTLQFKDVTVQSACESVLDKLVIGELVTLYEARGENDTNEGRGGSYLIGYYLDEVEARESVKDKGVWGAPGSVYIVNAFKQYLVNGDVKYWKISETNIDTNIKSDVLRQQALSKLTPEEIKLLGIK